VSRRSPGRPRDLGRDGTGLGLGDRRARVAEAHGWSVRIEDGDRLGGARFVVEP